MNDIQVYLSNVVYSESKSVLVEKENAYIVVENGIIEGLYRTLPEKFASLPLTDYSTDVIIPAFSDLHTHAPQYPQRGLKTDALLYDWLNKYTFPLEERYKDKDFAKAVYETFCDDLIANGTMHVVTFGTIHNEATGLLTEILEKKGLSAYVGKVNMDINSPSFLCEDTALSIQDTESFLEKYSSNKNAKPILTPRFAPTCSRKLLSGLGKLAKKYRVGVHTHLVESMWEKEEAKRLNPDCTCDTQIYEKEGMLGYGPFIGAHFIFPSEEDIEILTRYNGFAVQCPDATVNVLAGIMPTKYLLERKVNLALGSDVAAGQNLGIFRQVASSVRLSKIKSFYEKGHNPITFQEAFYMATKKGGSLFGKVGSLEKGYVFDALVIENMSDVFMPVSPAESIERFCASGEIKNIKAKYLNGKLI